MAKPLRAVAPNEKAPAKTPTTVVGALETGSRRDELVAMRMRIARAIDDPNIRGADLAALSRRQIELGKEIDAMDASAKQEATEHGEVADQPFDSEAI